MNALTTYVRTAVRVWSQPNAAEIAEKIQPGEYGCVVCGRIAPKGEFRPGRGRSFGEHPDQQFCTCGHNITWGQVIDGDVIVYRRKIRKQAS